MKVLIATPAHTGQLDVWYVNSLVNSVRIAQEMGIFLHPVFMSYDALVQRARNGLFKLAVEGDYDAMIFIDADMEWNPEWIMEMLEREEHVIGGTARKKTDDEELYVAKTRDLTIHDNGMIKCEGLGTGFVKLSKDAVHAVWDMSEPYTNNGKTGRMVCNVEIVDGELYSEDTAMFRKLKDLGFDLWLAPHMTCGHVGTKKFVGDFDSYIKRIKESAEDAIDA